MASIREGELLWQPSEHFKAQSRLADYMRWLAANHGLQFETYDDLWRWSAGEIERFWVTIYEYFDIHLPRHFRKVLSRRAMPGAHWFEGAEINYAEQVFRHATDQWPAIVFRSETRPAEEISWAQLRHETAHVATALRSAGINPGDRVVAYMPNIPQTISAFLGAASVGAVWSSCSPDFGLNAVIDRFAQIEPRVLFAVDGYRYGGKAFDRREVVRDLLAALPTVERVVLIPYLDEAAELDGALRWPEMLSQRARDLTFEPVPFEHPLWILYSSGTTGLPKGLVHGHGGVVLEHTKVLALHQDINPGDRLFWFTSTGWMMWNYVVSALLVGATPAIYDGNPGYPDLDVLWQYAEDARLTVFGTSAAYVTACMKAGLEPGNRHDLSALRNLSSTGSPLPVEGFAWVYEDVKPDLWLTSVSGGTDVVSAFVVGNPLLPVYAGELQCRALGVNIQSFHERG
ncbi:MAG: acetoacetate--CoA ligase, partial [Chloroflexi bacterium]|nr:acetoacetate--CoA ligase [Chloroflexota bacterium]